MKKTFSYFFLTTVIVILMPINVFSQETKYSLRNGIFFEIKPDSTNSRRYTEDNILYKGLNINCFDYECYNSNGEQFYYERIENDWQFVAKDKLSENTIVAIMMTVNPDLGTWSDLPDYDQTIIKYNYLTFDNKNAPVVEETGLVENQKNIWFHPPRTDLFQILELNPFPFIHFQKNKWETELEIGGIWGDKRWITWEGLITNNINYEIVEDVVIIDSFVGKLKCRKIKALAISKLGETSLISFFNEKYGFVRLEYINIDKSRIILTLKDCS